MMIYVIRVSMTVIELAAIAGVCVVVGAVLGVVIGRRGR